MRPTRNFSALKSLIIKIKQPFSFFFAFIRLIKQTIKKFKVDKSRALKKAKP